MKIHPTLRPFILAAIISSIVPCYAAPTTVVGTGEIITSNAGLPLSSQSYSNTLDTGFWVGVGFSQLTDASAIVLGSEDTISVTNLSNNSNSGATGILLSQSTLGTINGTLSVTGEADARALWLTSTDSFDSDNSTALSSSLAVFSGSLNATAESGTAYGIYLFDSTLGDIESTTITTTAMGGGAVGINLSGTSTISDLSGTTIKASASNAGTVVGTSIGILVRDSATVGSFDNIIINSSTSSESSSASGISMLSIVENSSYQNMNISVSGIAGQLNLVSARFTPASQADFITLSGDFNMSSNNESGNNSYSVGYLLGTALSDTSASVGIKNSGMTGTSMGFLLDWDNTNLNVQRNYGFTAGVAIIGTAAVTALDLQGTVVTAGNSITTSVESGAVVAAFLQGVDLSEGALYGTLNATATEGIAVGLGTVGSDLSVFVNPTFNFPIITQIDTNSTINQIGGIINVEVENETAAETLAVGVQLGNVNTAGNAARAAEYYKTTMTGNLSGVISVQLNDTQSGDVTLQSGNIVAGIINYGSVTDAEAAAVFTDGTLGADVLRFDARANTQNADPEGTRVSSLIYSTDSSTNALSLVGLGQAVQSLVGDIEMTTRVADGSTASVISTTSSNRVNLQGNLVAGSTGTQALRFQEGHFLVSSNRWVAAEEVSFGTVPSSVDELYAITSVQLSNIVTVSSRSTNTTVDNSLSITSSTLSFTGNNTSDVSQLIVGIDMTLELENLTDVYVYLYGTQADYENSIVYFLDARETDFFDADNTGITYHLSLSGSTVTQTDEFEIRHDETGIYLYSLSPFVPEPSTAMLSLVALLGLLGYRRRAI